jgi:nucleotide-binding universal stress UspA family protein
MKILATFDGSPFSESIIPQLRTLCQLPGAEVQLLRVGEMPQGRRAGNPHAPLTAVTPASTGGTPVIVERTPTAYAENKEQAVERVKEELAEYLQSIARQLPDGVPCTIETMLDADVKSAIVRFVTENQPDLIVMATHGRTGLVHALSGSVTESVVRSGVAPVLLVHPREIAKARQTAQQG